MRVVRLRVRNFRCIQSAEIFPVTHNVLLGANNSGKTAVLEALNLLLNPELTHRQRAIDENDFYLRQYLPRASEAPAAAAMGEAAPLQGAEAAYPAIYIEAVISDLAHDDEEVFANWLVPWRTTERRVVERADEGEDAFANSQTAIRVFFEGRFDSSEDDFAHNTYFLPADGTPPEDCPPFTRDHKRHIGFLIYRDFRALTRPITLEPATLFGRLLSSQEAAPRRFEDILQTTYDSLAALRDDPEFASLISTYQAELQRFLPLTPTAAGTLTFDLTDRTRAELKAAAQLYTWDGVHIPSQRTGAGTRSLAILATLTVLMRRRKRGILALEEPETFLFPHAQRRVIDECLSLADQTFITTHSPFVLERVPVEGVGRLSRGPRGTVMWQPLGTASIKKTHLYSRFLRKAHCEALVGNAVIVVEGDSDRWWLNGVGRVANGETVFGRVQEALELQGISVASAEGHGDVLRLAEFFQDAGLRVVCLFDHLTDAAVLAQIRVAPIPCLTHRHDGLEALLAQELPVKCLRQFLTGAPHAKALPLKDTEVAALPEAEVRSAALKHLAANKGAAFMHEWLIGQVALEDLPASLVIVVDLVTQYVKHGLSLGYASVGVR